MATDTLPSFGGGNSSTFNNQMNDSNLTRPIIDNDDQMENEESKEAAWFEKAYPFKADDFGQLVLPENVIKAKLVSLNSYGAMLPVNLMMSNRNRHQPTESQTSGTFFLFTIDDNDYLTLYKIKSYLTSPLSNIITNFKMAKKMDVLLEYPVQ